MFCEPCAHTCISFSPRRDNTPSTSGDPFMARASGQDNAKRLGLFAKRFLLVALLAALPAMFAQSDVSAQGGKGPIKVGILHSLTGTMAISEKSLKDAELMAIEEINAKGGVMGRKVEAIVEDPESKFTTVFPDKAKKLLLSDKVAAVFGCWTSVSRKNVLPVFEENNGLLFYPVQYEGNESSKNVIYSGAAPNQQILPAVEWLIKEGKKKFYLLGTDYVFPRTANLIIVKYIEDQKKNHKKDVEVVEEKYTPFGYNDYASIIQDIKAKSP